MRSTAHVMPPAAFNAWLAKQRAPAAAAGGSASAGGAAQSPTQLAALGKQTFTGQGGCAGCHTLADAGATGTAGPNLGVVLKGKNAAFIRTSIVNPNAFIAPGYQANVMPQNFGQSLTPQQLDGLVAYLATVSK
jgi:cytochrome c oxidase subunit 2